MKGEGFCRSTQAAGGVRVLGMRRTILIVDDDPEICDMLRRTLVASGYDTVCAGNGWEALLALDEHASIDAILLDILMPGMDGATFLKIARASAKTRLIPVLVTSVLSEDDVRDRTSAAVDAYVPKGRIQEVVAALEGMLKSSEPTT